MLIALLAVLGVDLIVLVALLALVLSRRRWVARQPGAFRGAIRVASGEVGGLGPRWRRGYGRWVRDVLVWTKAPFLFRNELVAIESLDGKRPARPDEIKRLGHHPVVARLLTRDAAVDLAARDEDGELLRGPFEDRPATLMAAQEEPIRQP